MAYPLKATGDDAWQETLVERVDGGVNTLERPDQLQLSEWISCLNTRLKKGSLLQDTGYKEFADAIVGTPQADYQFFKKNGQSELLLITTASVYVYNATHNQWQLVKGTTSTLVNGAEVAGQTNITVDSSAGFSIGNLVGITLDNGSQHKTTISGVPDGTHIDITDAIPVGRSAPDNAQVVRGVVLAGTLDNHPVMDTVASHDWFVFTNNVDRPKRYDGTDCVDIPNLPSGGNTVCKALRVFNNTLFLFNTIEGGTAHPQRARRCDAGDPTNWTTGTAGFDDLFDAPDFIMCGEVLGPYIIVYRERSIMRGSFVGTGGIEYKFDPVAQGEGVLSVLSVVDMGDHHIFIGNANIYEYRGGFDYEPIGDKIYYELFGSEANVNPSMKHRAFAFYVEELDEIWFFVPSINSDLCDRLIRYSVGDKIFHERQFNLPFCGYGFYQRQDTFTWNDLIGSWLDQVWQWNSRSIQANAPTTHLCPASGSAKVMEYDYVSVDDSGVGIEFLLETRDFVIQNAKLRFDSIEGLLRGSGVLVECSLDEGQSYLTLGTVTNTVHQKFKLDRQLVDYRIRFRMTGSDPQFLLSLYNFFWKLESVR